MVVLLVGTSSSTSRLESVRSVAGCGRTFALAVLASFDVMHFFSVFLSTDTVAKTLTDTSVHVSILFIPLFSSLSGIARVSGMAVRWDNVGLVAWPPATFLSVDERYSGHVTPGALYTELPTSETPFMSCSFFLFNLRSGRVCSLIPTALCFLCSCLQCCCCCLWWCGFCCFCLLSIDGTCFARIHKGLTVFPALSIRRLFPVLTCPWSILSLWQRGQSIVWAL